MSLCSMSSKNHGILCDCFTKWKCHFPGISPHQTLHTPTGLSPLLLGEKEMTEKQKLKFLSRWEPTQSRFDTCLEAKYKCLLAEHRYIDPLGSWHLSGCFLSSHGWRVTLCPVTLILIYCVYCMVLPQPLLRRWYRCCQLSHLIICWTIQ